LQSFDKAETEAASSGHERAEGQQNQKMGQRMQNAWQRRHAVQIVAQLPEKTDDALAVLELARELVEGFLAGPGYRLRVVTAGDVMAFSAASSSALSVPGSPSALPK
jgi:hypothetical protein